MGVLPHRQTTRPEVGDFVRTFAAAASGLRLPARDPSPRAGLTSHTRHVAAADLLAAEVQPYGRKGTPSPLAPDEVTARH